MTKMSLAIAIPDGDDGDDGSGDDGKSAADEQSGDRWL